MNVLVLFEMTLLDEPVTTLRTEVQYRSTASVSALVLFEMLMKKEACARLNTIMRSLFCVS